MEDRYILPGVLFSSNTPRKSPDGTRPNFAKCSALSQAHMLCHTVSQNGLL